jgi:hypothetical protein
MIGSRAACVLALLGCAFLVGGCGNYKATFRVAPIINAWGGDHTKEQLDVDIVCLGKEEAQKLPQIVDGSLRSDEWFRLRDTDDPKIAVIPPGQIYALRSGTATDRRDTLKGPALLSGVNRTSGGNETTVAFSHPKFLESGAAIAIYGRFVSERGLARTPPIVIKPPPRWLANNHVTIDVGRNSMECVNCP